MGKPLVFIDGEAGTTGLGIRDRLRALRAVELRSLPDERRKDPGARREIMAEVDLVVLCLPDDAARESVALADGLGNQAPRLLDASTAHRVHPDWTYGFADLAPGQAERIADALGLTGGKFGCCLLYTADSADDPLTYDEVAEKFGRFTCTLLDEARRAAIIEAVAHLEDLTDLSTLAQLIRDA